MLQRTILLAHGDASALERIVPQLSDLGYEIVGPARTAGAALALAAVTPVSFALIGERLAGRRDGRALGQALRENWGLRCGFLREAAEAAQ